MKGIIVSIVSFFILFGSSLATVGGPQELELLGHDSTTVYYLYHFYDESDEAPQMWKFNLNDRTLEIDQSWCNYPDETIEDALKRINLGNAQLIPIAPDVTYPMDQLMIFQLDSISRFSEYYQVYHTVYPFKVQFGDVEANIEVYFDNGNAPQITQFYTINDLHFVELRYNGILMEGGYKKDTLIVFQDISQPTTTDLPDSTTTAQDTTSNDKAEDGEKGETYWKKGSPNYMYIIVPLLLVLIPIVILKSKKGKKD